MNSRAIVYSSFHLWNIAADGAQRAREIKATSPKACTADTIGAILLAAMSTEAFINELGTHLLLLELSPELPEIERWTSVGTLLEQLEKEKAQIKTKYLWVSQILPGCPLTKGKPPFQDFSRLIDMRNDIVHPRALEKEPKYLQDFSQRRWLYNNPEDEPKLAGWLFQLETPEIAAWACRAALAIITDFVERFKNDPHPLIAALHSKMHFQWGNVSNDPRVVS
ncbi:MAG: hypothetical protein RKP20_17800 [Candidatus Competibacter sp.]|nr:hypothetical protein [Candidatus Competibacter sp.]